MDSSVNSKIMFEKVGSLVCYPENNPLKHEGFEWNSYFVRAQVHSCEAQIKINWKNAASTMKIYLEYPFICHSRLSFAERQS
jgi:hypothetical protein